MNVYKLIRKTAAVLTCFFTLGLIMPVIAEEQSFIEAFEEGMERAFGDDAQNGEEAVELVEDILIDDMTSLSVNKLNGRNSTYVRSPSTAYFSKSTVYGRDEGEFGLKIYYNKKNGKEIYTDIGEDQTIETYAKPGPYGDGGWCGFYSVVHKGHSDYLDASKHNYLTFWVKGKVGGEDFKIGAAGLPEHQIDDSVKTEKAVSKYLIPSGITTEWKFAVVPTEDIIIDWEQLHSLAFCFETDVFSDSEGVEGTEYFDNVTAGSGEGEVYISEIVLNVDNPIQYTSEAATEAAKASTAAAKAKAETEAANAAANANNARVAAAKATAAEAAAKAANTAAGKAEAAAAAAEAAAEVTAEAAVRIAAEAVVKAEEAAAAAEEAAEVAKSVEEA